MRAVTLSRLDGPEAFEVSKVATPPRGHGEVLVAVQAVAPAFPDLLLSRGEYQVKPELPFSPGSDLAGVVLEADEDSGFMPGQRVAGCLLYGAAAEVISVPAGVLYPVPDSVTLEAAAALPMNYLTAYYALILRGQAKSGDWVLVTGASGGVGLATIQVAKGIGCNVIALVSSEKRRAVAEQAGADHVVVPEDLPTKVKQITGNARVDVAVDMVGGDVTNLLRILAPLGRLMIVGFASGEVPTVKVNRLLLNNTDVRGVDSARMLFETGESRPAWDHLLEMYEAGHVRPIIVDGGDFGRYGEALQQLQDRSVTGRVVLTAGTGSTSPEHD